ncbi:MAG: outer membrane protein assembly factor BamD [Firmicutes bacterium]|nr:outer membrane protein assembly factor BamD [Bacillota bacterium]
MRLKSSLLPLLCLAVLATSAVGCRKAKIVAKKKDDGTRTAAQLVSEADVQFKRGKWDEGRRLLRIVEEQLPSSPEFSTAKLMLADSFFFQSVNNFPEALVEYQSFLNYFPRHEKRDLALYRVALCHYAAIETAERDQAETRLALDAFQRLLKEVPGSPYAVDAKAKITQCWRRLAEYELMVGIQYVNGYNYGAAESRIKGLMETYPDYVDRERAYFYLGEAMRRKTVPLQLLEQHQKDFLARIGKEDVTKLDKDELEQLKANANKLVNDEIAKYRQEAKDNYQRLVESYPSSPWTPRAKDRLLEMGQSHVKEELDS